MLVGSEKPDGIQIVLQCGFGYVESESEVSFVEDPDRRGIAFLSSDYSPAKFCLAVFESGE